MPGALIDWANKMTKPVTNYWTTYRRLWEKVLSGEIRREAYQTMARWIADNPPYAGDRKPRGESRNGSSSGP